MAKSFILFVVVCPVCQVTIENAPQEYLTGIRGTLGYFAGHLVVKSLCFTTNLKSYETIGTAGDGTPFSLVLKGGAIAGFHGRSGAYLDAIGVYLQQPEQIKPLKQPKVEENNGNFPNNVRIVTVDKV